MPKVYPYYDTGKTALVGTKVLKDLIALRPFGMYVDHNGLFYGFGDSIVGTNTTLTQVAPNVYTLAVPDEPARKQHRWQQDQDRG